MVNWFDDGHTIVLGKPNPKQINLDTPLGKPDIFEGDYKVFYFAVNGL